MIYHPITWIKHNNWLIHSLLQICFFAKADINLFTCVGCFAGKDQMKINLCALLLVFVHLQLDKKIDSILKVCFTYPYVNPLAMKPPNSYLKDEAVIWNEIIDGSFYYHLWLLLWWWLVVQAASTARYASYDYRSSCSMMWFAVIMYSNTSRYIPGTYLCMYGNVRSLWWVNGEGAYVRKKIRKSVSVLFPRTVSIRTFLSVRTFHIHKPLFKTIT